MGRGGRGGEWPDLAALRKAAHGSAKPFDPGPGYRCPTAPITMTAEGPRSRTTRARDKKARRKRERVSGPFEILGNSRNPKGAIGAYGFAGKTATGERMLGM